MEERRDNPAEEMPQAEAMAEPKEQGEQTQGSSGQTGGQTQGRMYTEEWTVRANQLMDTIDKLLRDSTVNRIKVKNREGRVVLDIPVWAAAITGAAAVILAPFVAAIGVVGGLVADFKVEVERNVPPEQPPQPEQPMRSEPPEETPL